VTSTSAAAQTPRNPDRSGRYIGFSTAPILIGSRQIHAFSGSPLIFDH